MSFLTSDIGLNEVEDLMRALADSPEGPVARTMVHEHLATGGKRLRARLALAGIEALGGQSRSAIAWAAACELLHNATLVHDDLQDGDELRRGEPTVWVRHGAAQAINAGDLLFALPYLAVDHLAAPDAVRYRLCRALAYAAATVSRGQAEELALITRSPVTYAAYEGAVRGKTSALFTLPIVGAALLTGADENAARCLAEPFTDVGVLFQLQDDVLDLYGDKGRKEPGSDLREGKVSGLVVEHLRLHPADTDALLALLRRPRGQVTQADVEMYVARFREGGALEQVLRRIVTLGDQVEAATRTASVHELAKELVAKVLAPIRPVLDSFAKSL